MKNIILVLWIVFFTTAYVNACTTFVLKDSSNLVYGQNFDWDIGAGFVLVNKKGIIKQALIKPPYKPAKWVSKYGSITFNQVGVDAPMSGINEKGLVVAQMGLFESEFPKIDEENVVSGLEWIQYQLDNSSTLEDVIKNNEKVRILTDVVPLHYFICDSLGNVGVIEYINKKLVIHQGKNVFISVCSNMIYELSKKSIKNYKGFGGKNDVPEKWNSISDIIVIANSMINNYKDNLNPVDYSFEILNSVSSSTRTQWSIIFDIKNRTINFRTRNNKNIRTLSLNSFEYSCTSINKILDIQKSNTKTDLIKQFTNLTFDYYFDYKKNLIALYKSNMKGFPNISDEFINLEVEYAIKRKCE
ncbi:MAG: linear amide C-N hydrolase [Melioribacteraceae bacterium]|nr:linear amide C-N hydrolase [Melioribacteraceae bacterium]